MTMRKVSSPLTTGPHNPSLGLIFAARPFLAYPLQFRRSMKRNYWDGTMTWLKSRPLAAVCGLAALALCSTGASASLIVTKTNGGTGINAISAGCSGPSGAPGSAIDGCLNNNHAQAVLFTTTDGPIKFAGGGQAKVQGADWDSPGFNNLTISLVGHTFNTLILNIEAYTNGFVTFTDNFGDPSVKLSLNGNGNNFFTITGNDFSWISLSTTDYKTSYWCWDGDIQDVKQVRFDGIKDPGQHNPPPSVPEPGTVSLLGIALAGLVAARRRRKAKA